MNTRVNGIYLNLTFYKYMYVAKGGGAYCARIWRENS